MELTPQQQLFVSYYLDPKSPTFSNVLQSGVKAGFSREYSESLGYQNPTWFANAIGKARNVKRLEKTLSNLDEVQELPIRNDEGKIVTDVLRERTKVDLFIAETLGKEEGYSKRNELTGANGKDFEIKTIIINKQ